MRSIPACKAAGRFEWYHPYCIYHRKPGMQLAVDVQATNSNRAVLTSQQMAPRHLLHRHLLSSHDEQCLYVILSYLIYTACSWLGVSSCPAGIAVQQHSHTLNCSNQPHIFRKRQRSMKNEPIDVQTSHRLAKHRRTFEHACYIVLPCYNSHGGRATASVAAVARQSN
jgi:hypothetical protein